MIRRLSLFLISLLLFSVTACGSNSTKPIEKEGFYMGTIITEKVYGNNAKKAADEVMSRIVYLENLMTINRSGSEIDKLNDAAGKNYVTLSPESINVINTAKKFSALSDGAFDITIGPLVKAWGVFTDHPRVPGQDEINQLLKLVNYKSLVVDDNKMSAKLQEQGQIVDLGGIAKGYAGDEAIKIYKKHGIKSAYINLGGNVVVLGNKPDGSAWKIGIKNPRSESKIIGVLKVSDKAVVTSGDYERFFMKDNKRYHHIIDPKTGYPADAGLISTTIVTDKSIDADSLSKVFVLGLDKGMKLIKSLKGVEAVFITSDKKVYITPGLKDVFTFNDESKEYTYVEKR
jgi:FAD:protein FMN transferase